MGRKRKWNNSTKEFVNDKWRDTKCYQTWKAMILRCYNSKTQEKCPTYIGCEVCTEWHDFDNFYVWFQIHYRDGFALDKDILVQGNKVYSPSTCMFVPQYINNLLVKSDAVRGINPIGVSFDKQNNKYRAQLKINGKNKYLGLFSDHMRAHQAYCTAKYAHIKEVALEAFKIGDIDQRVYNALLNYKIEMY